MKEILEKLQELAAKNNQIVLYKTDAKIVAKGVGRIMGKFDSDLFEFLKVTNGASIFDYCFMGFKNPKLGVDIDKFMLELWSSNNKLAGHFLPFMGTSTSDNFGYLIDIIDSEGRHPIAYYSDTAPQHMYLIASSFKNFMETFLNEVQNTLGSNSGKIIINIDAPNWPTDINHWLRNDATLTEMKKDAMFNSQLKTYMPDMRFF